jgi:2-iminobutanoate/2-iminopropanoate deaminase
MAAPHLSQSVRVGDVVYTSGQVAFRDGKIEGDIAAQTRQVIANLEQVLSAHGLGLAAIVKTTVWLKHQADFAVFNDAYAAAFGEHRPARSTTVADLALPEALVEIEAVARMGAAW